MNPPDWSLVRYRPLLKLHVRTLQIGRMHRARFDSSDVVQETLFRAIRGLEGLRGITETELLGWLRKILSNVFVDFLREQSASIRDVAMERSITVLELSSETPISAYLATVDYQPDIAAQLQEEIVQLSKAIDQLPEVERDVIIAHHLLQLPVAEVASRLDRSEKSVAGLLYRAKNRLRITFQSKEDSR